MGPSLGSSPWGPSASWKPGKAPKGNSGVGEAQGPCFWSLPELFMTRYLVCQKEKKNVLFHKKEKLWLNCLNY